MTKHLSLIGWKDGVVHLTRSRRLEKRSFFLRCKLGPAYVPDIKARKISHFDKLRTGSLI